MNRSTPIAHAVRPHLVRGTPALLALLVLVIAAPRAWAQDPVSDFKQNCSSCHTIGGGRLTGPDLKDVDKRKDRAWLVRFITDPGSMLDGGDPYALKLLQEARNVRMPNVAGMSKARAERLMDLIIAESKLEKSQFKGVQIPTRPFTAADVESGRDIFTGRQRLENGGAACISCHTVGGLGGLGGGRLGVDLTKVFERYEDRRKLAAWLTAPATETMLPTFRKHPMTVDEILPLVAYFEHTAKHEEEDNSPAGLIFILLGLGGAVGVLIVFNMAWRGRFRGVRKRLVQSTRIGPPSDQVPVSGPGIEG